jgi:hypothetical protein
MTEVIKQSVPYTIIKTDEQNTIIKTDEQNVKIIQTASVFGTLTGAEIKALYEAENDTNVFTDAEKTKLNDLNIIQYLGDPTNTDYSDSNYFYFGYSNINGNYIIERQDRTSSVSLRATVINNPTYTVYNNAWTNKSSLVYA